MSVVRVNGDLLAGDTATDAHDRVALSVRDLVVDVWTDRGWLTAVDGVSYDLRPGETLGIVGESGSGKTLHAYGVMGLLDNPRLRIASGQVLLDGVDLVGRSYHELQAVRARRISMIFQEPRRSLNPSLSVGRQIAEVVLAHERTSKKQAWDRAVEALDAVGIKDAPRRAREHPHVYSGGMCQRAMIAMAVVLRPAVLICDEATTALDVTVQARVLDLLRKLQADLDLAIVIITHDLGVIADISDRVGVMYAGQMVEQADVMKLFERPNHPYTAGLLNSVTNRGGSARRLVGLPGNVPQLGEWAQGCRFAPRCSHAAELCTSGELVMRPFDGQVVRCARVEELQLQGLSRRE